MAFTFSALELFSCAELLMGELLVRGTWTGDFDANATATRAASSREKFNRSE